jgi:hypothetical protein
MWTRRHLTSSSFLCARYSTQQKLRIAERAAAKKFEKDWAKYRIQNGLDLYGKVVDAEAATAPFDKPRCAHGAEEAQKRRMRTEV